MILMSNRRVFGQNNQEMIVDDLDPGKGKMQFGC